MLFINRAESIFDVEMVRSLQHTRRLQNNSFKAQLSGSRNSALQNVLSQTKPARLRHKVHLPKFTRALINRIKADRAQKITLLVLNHLKHAASLQIAALNISQIR